MGQIILNGASDDLIEIEIKGIRNEEFNVEYDTRNYLTISDGSIFKVEYDEWGIWRFYPVVVGDSSIRIDAGRDDDYHSDRVVIEGERLTWVALSTQIAK